MSQRETISQPERGVREWCAQDVMTSLSRAHGLVTFLGEKDIARRLEGVISEAQNNPAFKGYELPATAKGY